MERDGDGKGGKEEKEEARARTKARTGCKRAREKAMVVHGVVRQITGEPTALAL